jgi:hypothetical protein
MARKPALAYFRVSRGRTHRKKLEILDQRIHCLAFAQRNGFVVQEEFEEIELGKGSDSFAARPQLERCILLACQTGAPILVASIDRIARNVNFLDELLQMNVTFIVTQSVANLSPTTFRAFSRKSGRRSSRVGRKAAPTTKRSTLREAAKQGHQALRDQADSFALAILPEIDRIRTAGAATLQAVADELDHRGVPTARGGRWTPTAVSRILRRAADAVQK